MGTSTSSSGPGSGISFDPPWLDTPNGAEDGGSGEGGQTPSTDPQPPRLAPERRFSNARRDLGRFIRSGDTDALRRGLGSYSKTGMGGAARLSARMGATTQAGAGLLGMLQATRSGADPAISQWVTNLLATNPSPSDIADAIVDMVASGGGTADEEALKDCMAEAFSELLAIEPGLNLLNMTDNSLWSLMELFLGNAVCNRIEFDIGQMFEKASLPPALAVQRETEMRDFVKNEVSSQLRALRAAAPNPTRSQLDSLMKDAIRMTFEVFEASV